MNSGANSSQGSMHLGYRPDVSCLFKPAVPDPFHNGDHIGMGGGVSASASDVLLKKKRGRPRKYGPDGSMAIPPPPPPLNVTQPAPGFTISHPAPPPPAHQHHHHHHQSPPPQQQLHSAHQVNVTPVPAPGSPQVQPKKARGRPPGASNKKHQLETLGSPGIGFTPHVIIVKAGEDVSSKIMSFSQNGPRAICILSANGALSNVTLRQAATSGGSVTYEGRFEILSLSGSFMLSDNEGHRSRTGGLSISLAGPDGRVIGGGVAGLLIAASPVQVVVASFITDDGREVKSGNEMEPMSGPLKVEAGTGATGTGASSPTSRGTVSESSGGGGGGGSPINHGGGGTVNSTPNMHGLPWM